MSTLSFSLFASPLGVCAIVWGEAGVVGLRLPEASEAKARARIVRRHPGAVEGTPPPDIRRGIERIQALLRGEPADLSDVRLDLSAVPDFERRVYEIARTIPPGNTLTYGEIAARLGDRLLARDVGLAMGRNPFPIVVPCHRVTAAGGKLGGFSAPGGADTKLKLLAIEGAAIGGQLGLFDRQDGAAA